MRAAFLVNPHAGAGQDRAAIDRLRPSIDRHVAESMLLVTHDRGEVAAAVGEAQRAGMEAIIAVGGDGTNQSLLEAVMRLPEPRPALGMLPVGTGRDWARTVGIPFGADAALRWLATAQPRPVDVGHLLLDGQPRHFFNVASVGLSGEIAQRVNRVTRKRPWTFMQTIVEGLLRFDPPAMRVWADDELFYDGDAFILSVANGRFFARGLPISPDSRVDDGRFDLVLVEGMSKPAVLRALPTLLRGTHLRRDDVHHRHARRVRVAPVTPPIGLDMDGEAAWATTLEFEVLPGAIRVLAHPSTDPTKESV